ncbi:hypothetical protein SEA_PUPPER_102 [Gordonia phage Pupper]|uniref:Uncharacterized protein n=1 Tax=Gordonia phage Pupper TaxID=2571249 RepID=A0A4Y6EIM9_9CAUD|nr:hypothetical protein KHQ83_gp175 [Gordonia phage Pupper]QDF18588.1 hypothetical protein SEA_PUPPER_102 [Gordonia phage Pupper]QDF18820.1 hypothetical protein SEA_SCENTAE_101 [Gordonia phage SCentae]
MAEQDPYDRHDRRDIGRKYAHLRERKRQADVEERGRAEVADLYENED